MHAVAQKVTGAVLDVGCGKKPYEKMFSQATHYYGVELPSYRGDYRHIDWYADGYHLPFRKDTFDTIILQQVLEHVEEPSVLLNELARVIKPGGRIIISTPQTWGIHEAPRDYYRYTHFGLRYLCQKAGLAVEEEIKTNGSIVTLIQRAIPFWLSLFPIRKNKVLELLLLLTVFVPSRSALFVDRLLHKKGETLYNVMVAQKPGVGKKINNDKFHITFVCPDCKNLLSEKNKRLHCDHCKAYYGKRNGRWNFTTTTRK